MNSVPQPMKVMQVIDTLDLGGAERMAVTIANLLPTVCCESHLCVTRRTGMLAGEIAPHVSTLFLERKTRFDMAALAGLLRSLRTHRIQILHAHGTSLFVAVLAARFVPSIKVIWHDHFGKKVNQKASSSYRMLAKRVDHLVVVNTELKTWAKQQLKYPSEKVTYLPNFVSLAASSDTPPTLSGSKDSRIVCLANLRPIKDHPTLLRAMQIVAKERPEAHLLLAGSLTDREYVEQIRQQIDALGLQNHVSLLGARQDVTEILFASEVGTLSSASEGLPLALIEYGMAGLPVVVTDVGQCAEVVEQGEAGLIVPPHDPAALANALLALLKSPELRRHYGTAFRQRVQQFYSPDAGMQKLQAIYTHVLKDARPL